VTLASRLYEPEPAAAAYRLGALVAALAARGAEVDVLTSRAPRGTPAAGAAPAGVRVRRWPVLRDRTGRVRGYVPYASFDVPLALRLLLARRPDVVVVETPPTTGFVVRLVAGLRRVPYAYYAADLLSAAAEGTGVPRALVALLRGVEGWVLRGAAAVLTVSPDAGERITALGVPVERVHVVGTGVDTRVFRPAAAPSPAPLLVYAGTMSEVHGASVFVEAFARVAARVPSARLVVLGGGTEHDAMRSRAEQLVPGRVTFAGTVPGDEAAHCLSTAWAGLASVRPGTGYGFAYATKVFAAGACGTPVVYAGVGPCAALVAEHALGWAVPWDVDAVAAAMAQALQAPPSAAERDRIAAWTRAEASLEAVAARASSAVLAVAARR
jgi:glycosyltransferase involved in cell wall biosynthesis